MNVEITYATEAFIGSFHDTLDKVARERIYIEMLKAPPHDEVYEFQQNLIAECAPIYYAIHESRVVGWCDISFSDNPRFAHRGGMGMGLLAEYRGRGLGSKLLAAALDHAKRAGLEKIELQVYTTNAAAIALYKKFGFEQEGLIRKFRKLEGQYFDCLVMAKFL